VALVIGNAQYQSERIPDLANPANDAEDVARALRGFGFSVNLQLDLDKSTMTEVMANFATTARTADVALFYYAGHGMQVDLRNYLAPTDAEYTSHEDVINKSVALDALTQAAAGMEGALLIFLDACQENPTGGQDGLARIPVARNQFVALAALPDALAADGAGRNSPFTEAFLANAGAPGKNISDVMLAVRQDVVATTGSQVPWDNSSLTREVVLVPGEETALSTETQVWRLASSLKDANLARGYLDRFPDGVHAADAEMLLASIGEAVPSRDATTVRALEVESDLWQLASSSRWPPLLSTYLERFPDGAHADEARELVAILTAPSDSNQDAAATCERLATHPNDATPAVAGVPGSRLRANAASAIAACSEAHRSLPQVHKFTALLARAHFVGGDTEAGLALFREAAEAGNIRALTTLGALYEQGSGVQQDLVEAAKYYKQAADAGAADATVNLARMMVSGAGVKQNVAGAVDLLKKAADDGSREAAFNLGVLAISDLGVPLSEAREYFALASDRGYAEGHFRAAALFDTERLGGREPERAAEYLLRAIASDAGDTLGRLQSTPGAFSADTIRQVQNRLAALGFLNGNADGQLGPMTLEALKAYRFGGIGTGA
jgi:hypothetical protein